MRRLNGWTYEDIVAYNLRDGGTAVTVFADAQTDRVNKARTLVSNIINDYPGRTFTIVEPGCSAGDIAGFFSDVHNCYGFDIVPAAVTLSRQRYPLFHVEQAVVENVVPIECDILILCEFLEHVIDPVKLVKDWLPLAKHVVIGHPIVGDGSDPEPGHMWAYTDEDYLAWFEMGGHTLVESYAFSMGYERMLIGRGQRK
jgi:hypothetical protein